MIVEPLKDDDHLVILREEHEVESLEEKRSLNLLAGSTFAYQNLCPKNENRHYRTPHSSS